MSLHDLIIMNEKCEKLEQENKELKQDLRWAVATCWNASQIINEEDIDGECEEVFERVKEIRAKYFKEKV